MGIYVYSVERATIYAEHARTADASGATTPYYRKVRIGSDDSSAPLCASRALKAFPRRLRPPSLESRSNASDVEPEVPCATHPSGSRHRTANQRCVGHSYQHPWQDQPYPYTTTCAVTVQNHDTLSTMTHRIEQLSRLPGWPIRSTRISTTSHSCKWDPNHQQFISEIATPFEHPHPCVPPSITIAPPPHKTLFASGAPHQWFRPLYVHITTKNIVRPHKHTAWLRFLETSRHFCRRNSPSKLCSQQFLSDYDLTTILSYIKAFMRLFVSTIALSLQSTAVTRGFRLLIFPCITSPRGFIYFRPLRVHKRKLTKE